MKKYEKLYAKLEKLAKEKKLSDWYFDFAKEILPSLVKGLKGDKKHVLYARVLKVSRSGMSREISLAIVHKGHIVNLNRTLFKFIYADQMREYDRVFISGCGMDLLFNSYYRLACWLFPEKKDNNLHIRYEYY